MKRESLYWYNGLDSGQMVSSLFIDLEKAFNTVDHDLCKNLEHCGIPQWALSWIQSHFYYRLQKQYSRVGGGGGLIV